MGEDEDRDAGRAGRLVSAPPWHRVVVGAPPGDDRPGAGDPAGRHLPVAPVVAEITRTYPGGVPRAGRGFVDDPAGALAELVEQMRAFSDAALGRRRAQVLLELDRPACTLELARRMGSAQAASATTWPSCAAPDSSRGGREGRRVISARTAKGDDLRAPH
jgi:hypothetical protein